MQQQFQQILVVDDDPIIRDMVVDILDLEGYSVQTARNGQEALDLLHQWQHAGTGALVFLDLMMPVMDGNAFCSYIEKHPQLATAHRIIVMSALDQLPQARLLRADATMPKPFVIDDLLRIITQYMES